MKEKIYLDTSVISAYYDSRASERMQTTREFWAKLNDYKVYYSEITVTELEATRDEKLRNDLLKLSNGFIKLKAGDEAKTLSEKYVNAGTIPKSYLADAIHIAVAAVNNIEILVSWNFEHMVNRKTRILVNNINHRNGYGPLEIISPSEL